MWSILEIFQFIFVNILCLIALWFLIFNASRKHFNAIYIIAFLISAYLMIITYIYSLPHDFYGSWMLLMLSNVLGTAGITVLLVCGFIFDKNIRWWWKKGFQKAESKKSENIFINKKSDI